MVDLTKEEVYSILIFAVFMAFWSFMFVPQFQLWVQEVPEPNPLFFYPLFNAVYIMLFAFLTYMLLRVLGAGGRRDFWDIATSAFRYGLAGFIFLWMIPDLIAPPYLITMEGELLKTHPLWPAVSDSFFYTLLEPHVPAQSMYVTVYYVVPILMFLAVLILVSPRKLAKLVKEL